MIRIRALLEENLGKRLYLFTTFGAVYAAVVAAVVEDVVELRGVDGKITYVNLTDVSSLRAYDEDPAR